MDESISPALKEAVIRRAGGRCEYCRSPARYSLGPFTIDHIIPKARGGKTRLDDLAFACSRCNGHKHAKIKATDPMTDKLVRLFNPRRQRWEGHFAWNEDYMLVIGLTSVGRATVDSLHLNREETVNLREVLRLLNRHPIEADA